MENVYKKIVRLLKVCNRLMIKWLKCEYRAQKNIEYF